MSNFRSILTVATLVSLGLGSFMYVLYAGTPQQTSGSQSNDHVSLMARYLHDGRFEDALSEGRLALKDDPDSPFILNQIAIVYLARAGKEADYREKGVREAVEYVERAVKNTSRTDPKALLDVVLAARSLKTAGDLSVEKCTYYRRAAEVLEKESPPANEDTTADMGGRTVSLAPIVQQKKQVLAQLQKHIADARCVPADAHHSRDSN